VKNSEAIKLGFDLSKYSILQESRLCVAVFLRFGIWSVDDSFDGHNQFPKLSLGVKFTDGLEIVAKPASRQLATAAAGPIRPSPKIGDSSVWIRMSHTNKRREKRWFKHPRMRRLRASPWPMYSPVVVAPGSWD
jgi:hypothetical protein